MANIIIGLLIFGYAGWALWRFIQKAKKGKCASCDIKEACASKSCCGGGSSHSSTKL